MSLSNSNVKNTSLDEDQSEITIVSQARRFGDCPVISPDLLGISKGEDEYFLHFIEGGRDIQIEEVSDFEVMLKLEDSQNATTQDGSVLGNTVEDAYVSFDKLP